MWEICERPQLKDNWISIKNYWNHWNSIPASNSPVEAAQLLGRGGSPLVLLSKNKAKSRFLAQSSSKNRTWASIPAKNQPKITKKGSGVLEFRGGINKRWFASCCKFLYKYQEGVVFCTKGKTGGKIWPFSFSKKGIWRVFSRFCKNKGQHFEKILPFFTKKRIASEKETQSLSRVENRSVHAETGIKGVGYTKRLLTEGVGHSHTFCHK